MAEDMVGFNLIKDMTKQELIDEIIHHHKREYAKHNEHDLRHAVIQIRIINYKERLTVEAALECDGQHGFEIG